MHTYWRVYMYVFVVTTKHFLKMCGYVGVDFETVLVYHFASCRSIFTSCAVYFEFFFGIFFFND